MWLAGAADPVRMPVSIASRLQPVDAATLTPNAVSERRFPVSHN